MPNNPSTPSPLRILLTGASGFLGSVLRQAWQQEGWDVWRLVQGEPSASNEISWHLDKESLEGFDAVVHLAGENIASGRWTVAKKRRIYESRVQGTRLLAGCLALLKKPPRLFASASAVGYYGNRGEEILTEESSPGEGFLATTCRDWEGATAPAAAAGIRTLSLRFGLILSLTGGALPRMLLPFRLGLGGKIGTGRQYMSPIPLSQAIRAVDFCLQNESLSGPVNIVSPTPITNLEWTRRWAKHLHRPALFPLPAFLARVLFGEMADELLLASQRVLPQKLMAAGFEFEATSRPSLRD